MTYKLRIAGGVILTATGAIIPEDAKNRQWQQYLEWMALGNTAEDADPLPATTQGELNMIAARNYAKLTALVGMTPSDISAWVDANINTFSDAKDALKTLAIAISVLGRRI